MTWIPAHPRKGHEKTGSPFVFQGNAERLPAAIKVMASAMPWKIAKQTKANALTRK
jgi:hypothetical protein